MSDDPLIGTRIADRFVVEQRIGRGGMGVVYRAQQASVGRSVALKILPAITGADDVLQERFEREARITASLRSPHTVTVFDFGRLGDGSLFIAMELLEGRSLAQIIASEAPLPPARVAALLDQIAASLEEAHAKGLIHRDLKPANIIVETRGGAEHVKVLDFGIAKVINAVEPSVTRTGTIIGTPQYISPEQCEGDPTAIGPRADLYALGVIAFEMLTGRLPFPSENAVTLLVSHLREAPPALSSLLAPNKEVERFEAIVGRLLAKKPEERHASAMELRTALREQPAPDAPPPRLHTAKERGKWIALVAVLGALSIGGVVLRARVDPPIEEEPLAQTTPPPPVEHKIEPDRDPVSVPVPDPVPDQPKRLHIAKIESTNLDAAQTERVIRERAKDLERCAIEGRAIYVTLLHDQALVAVRPTDPRMQTCIAPILEKLEYPRPTAEFATITVRFSR